MRKHPPNADFNGYVNQKVCREPDGLADGLSHHQRLKKRGSPEVGPATVFLSWFLGTPIQELYEALLSNLHVEELPEDTKFWVRDFVICLTKRGTKEDLEYLGECVMAMDRTVLIVDDWRSPSPLKRSYRIKEVVFTHEGGNLLDDRQGKSCLKALTGHEEFDQAAATFASVRAERAKARNEDQQKILTQLKEKVGIEKCSQLVIGLLRQALIGERVGGSPMLCRLSLWSRIGRSTIWVCCSSRAGTWRAQGRCTRRPCRRAAGRSAMPTPPGRCPSATRGRCSRPWGAWRAPGRCTRRPCRRVAGRSARDHLHAQILIGNMRALF